MRETFFFLIKVWLIWGFYHGSDVKNLPAMQEIRVLSLSQEHPLEKEMATHSSILAKSQGQRSLVGQSMGSQRVGH